MRFLTTSHAGSTRPSTKLPSTSSAVVTAWTRRTAVLAVGLIALTGCGSDYPLGEDQRRAAENANSNLTGSITGAGSSAQRAAMEAWKASFAAIHPKTQIQYSPDGSGAGRTALLADAVDFAGSDAYLEEEEFEKSKEACGPDGAFNIPAYVSPISVAFNVPGIKSINMDAATIAAIFRGEITNWNDPTIASQNPELELPDLRIAPINRSDDSGTTENFTDYLHEVAPEAWPYEPDGTWPGELGGENAKGNAGVVSTMAKTVGSITYADDSAVGEELGTVALKVGDDYVPVSAEGAAIAVDQAEPVEGRPEYDLALNLDRQTTAPGAYPLVLVSYHIYCTTYTDAETAELVRTFGTYVVSDEGQQASAEAAKSAPISESLSERATDAISRIDVR